MTGKELLTWLLTPRSRCGLPPAGWSCSRRPGHPGPCAASRRPLGTQKVLTSPTYTGFKLQFGLYAEQQALIDGWIRQHDEERHLEPGETNRYSGAIGGAYSYCFTPTSIGVAVSVRCSCGEEINVSDYDQW